MPRIASTTPDESDQESSDASSSSSARVQGPSRRSGSNLAHARTGSASAAPRAPPARKRRSRASRGGGGKSRRSGPGPQPRRKDNMGETVMKLLPVDSRDGSVDTEGIAEGVEKRWFETKEFRGRTYIVDDDELVLPSDERGDTKVDSNGVLLGGREYKMPTFTSKSRNNPNKHYMLAIDAARSAGFRDSLYFFRRNPLILRLTCTQTEKEALIAAGCLHNNLRSRPVTICSARNAYKVVGARFLMNGKHVTDDYYEEEAIAAGAIAGEPAIPEQILAEQERAAAAAAVPAPVDAEMPSRGGSPPPGTALPPTSGPTTAFRNALRTRTPIQPLPGRMIFGGDGRPPYGEKGWDVSEKKRKPSSNLTPLNWMTEYARATSEMNRYLRGMRRDRLQPLDLGFSQELEGEEWEDVEVDMPIDSKGRIIRSDDEDELEDDNDAGADAGSGDDQEEEEDEEDGDEEEEEETTSVMPTAEPSTQVSRATSSMPLDASNVQIHGGEKARYILDGAGLSALAPTAASAVAARDDVPSPMPSTLFPPGAGAEVGGPEDAPSPDKILSKRKMEARWTTTVKERKLVEKGPPKVLWDPYTGGAIVRKDLQPTSVEVVQLSSAPVLSDEATKKEPDSDSDDEDEVMANGDAVGLSPEEQERKKRKRLLDASRAGIATVEVLIRDLPQASRPTLLPGMWDFGAPRS